MRPDRVMTQRCTLTLRLVDEDTEERDDQGNPVPEIVTVPDVPCYMEQLRNVTLGGETAGLDQIQEETYLVLLPAVIVRTVDDGEVEVKPDGIDAIEVDGIPYELHGTPSRVYNPRRRRVTHVEATARRAA